MPKVTTTTPEKKKDPRAAGPVYPCAWQGCTKIGNPRATKGWWYFVAYDAPPEIRFPMIIGTSVAGKDSKLYRETFEEFADIDPAKMESSGRGVLCEDHAKELQKILKTRLKPKATSATTRRHPKAPATEVKSK
jgi:hypothetical protein